MPRRYVVRRYVVRRDATTRACVQRGVVTSYNGSRDDSPRPHPAVQPVRALRILRVQTRELHAAGRAVDELELAHVHADVGHAGPGPRGEQQDVSRAEGVDERGDLASGARLIATHARQPNAVLPVGVLNQPRAIEPVVGRTTPD